MVGVGLLNVVLTSFVYMGYSITVIHFLFVFPPALPQVNMVFDNVRVMQNYSGHVLFLEEDHYVAPDFLQVASQLIHMKQDRCADCDFINLGMYNKARVLTNRVCHHVSTCDHMCTTCSL